MGILISIVIPLYNKSKFIEKTLNSILYQKYDSYEVIIVDDGSTDNSFELVKYYIAKNNLNDRFFLFCQQNQGVSIARNTGVSKARGKLLVFLDADDRLNKGYLEDIFSTYQRLNGDFDVLGYDYSPRTNKIPEDFCNKYINYFEHYVRFGPPFCSSSVVVKNSPSVKFPEGEWLGEDIYLWTEFALNNAKIYYRNFIASEYVYDDNSAMSKKKDLIKVIRDYNEYKFSCEWYDKFIRHHEADYLKSCLLHNDIGSVKLFLDSKRRRKEYILYWFLTFIPVKFFNFLLSIKRRFNI